MNSYRMLMEKYMGPPQAPAMEERFPRIYQTIQTKWGTKDCRNYLSNLFIQDRDGDRSGFDFAVLIEIGRLLETHDEDFPVDKPTSNRLFC